MKNLIVLIDTNLILDVLEKRSSFYDASNTVLTYCAENKIEGYIALHSISNIYYILRKHYSPDDRKKLLLGILDFLHVVNIEHENVRNALRRKDFSDFEDCLQDECAERVNADYIVTRNIKDFSESKVPAIEPENLVKFINN